MSKISAGLKKTIKEIKRLSDGSINDQQKACKELLQKKIFPFGKLKTGIPVSVIPELLPRTHVLEEESVKFVHCVTCTPDEKTNRKLLIDAGVVSKLVNLLSSANTDVMISTMGVLINITRYFPETVVENEILPTIIQCLKSDNKLISQYSAWLLQNISTTSKERVAVLFEADGVKPLIEILESKDDATIKHVLWTLIMTTYFDYKYCQRILDLGTLKSLKKLCDRLFVTTKKLQFPSQAYLRTLRERKVVKRLVIKLISNITFYGEDQVNLIIKENFIPIILQQIKGGMTPQIKIESIEVIKNVVSVKPDFIPALVQDYYILSFCYSNIGSTNADLLISSLNAIYNVIELFEDRDITRQKLRECGGPTKLSNLFEHPDEEIRHLSTMIYEFVFDVKPVAGVAADVNHETELIELDSEDDDTPETPHISRQRKRPATTQPAGPLRRSKRFRISLEQTDTENTESSSSDESDNDQWNDFDDHPINSSPAGAASTESNRHDHSGLSFVSEDTVAADDGPSRLNPKTETPPTPPNVDIPATSASHQLPDLPVAASTNNETAQNEMKPSLSGQLGNRSRRASNHSHVKPEASSTNEENIRTNPAGIPSVFDSETAATGDETIPNADNPGKQSPADDDISAIAPALPAAAASTNHGTMPNDIPSRKPSPVPQPVTTFVLPNQAAAARNDDIIRDETIKYWRPAEFLIDQYCGTLEIQFNRKDYDAFIPKIIFDQITSNSKPDAIFQPIDQSGFGCLSILLTGNEDASSTIRMKINKKFINDLMQSGNFDEEKITSVIAPPYLIKEEHLQTVATWLKCRILVYCSVNGWKKYGSWDTEDQMIPLFVLEKKEIDGKPVYCIVLTLKND